MPQVFTKHQALLTTKDDMNDSGAADAVISHETKLKVISTDAYLLELLADQPIKVQVVRDFMHRFGLEWACCGWANVERRGGLQALPCRALFGVAVICV